MVVLHYPHNACMRDRLSWLAHSLARTLYDTTFTTLHCGTKTLYSCAGSAFPSAAYDVQIHIAAQTLVKSWQGWKMRTWAGNLYCREGDVLLAVDGQMVCSKGLLHTL